MAQKKKSSDTIRIDLIPEAPARPTTRLEALERKERAPVSRLTKMNWRQPPKPPSHVARSRYQELLQSVYDAAIITTVSGNIVDVNIRALEFLLYERSELCGMMLFDIISGSDGSVMSTLCESLQNERFVLIQAYCVRSDGTSFPAEIAVNKLELDQVRLCFFVRDITLRMQAEEQLRAEHRALQISGNGVIISDLDVKIEYVNPAFADMVGAPNAESLMGADLLSMFAVRAKGEELMTRVMSDPRTWTTELTMKRIDGEEVFVQVSATCNRNPDDEAVGVVFSFADITAHRDAEKRLQSDSQKQLAKDAEQLGQLEAENLRLRARLEEQESSTGGTASARPG